MARRNLNDYQIVRLKTEADNIKRSKELGKAKLEHHEFYGNQYKSASLSNVDKEAKPKERVNTQQAIAKETGFSTGKVAQAQYVQKHASADFSCLKKGVVGNDNPVKLGRCFAELDRINGVHNGNHMREDFQNENPKSQAQLAEELGISQQKYSRYKSLTKLIPELEDMVETGKVTATTASAIARNNYPSHALMNRTFRSA